MTIVGMREWTVDVMVELPGNESRDETFTVEAISGTHAIVEAMARIHLKEDELLHTVHAHIGLPKMLVVDESSGGSDAPEV